MSFNRRRVLIGATTAAAAATISLAASSEQPTRSDTKSFAPPLGPRARVLVVNDISGDIDGLFATTHALMCPSTEVRGIVGTGNGRSSETAARAAGLATEIVEMLGLQVQVRVYPGTNGKLSAPMTPVDSPGSQAIINEAMRTDTTLPLYVTVGGGLTEVASALLTEPRIAGKFTLVWIGGSPYPNGGSGETNFSIDKLAAHYIFNETTIPL